MADLLIRNGQQLLPMMELIEQSRMAVQELIDCVDRVTIQAVLMAARGGEFFELLRRRKLPLIGNGKGMWSFIHVVDDDPASVAEWLPELAQILGAKKPMHVPRLIGRLFAGETGVVMMTDARGASNANAKRELGWRPVHPSWRHGSTAWRC